MGTCCATNKPPKSEQPATLQPQAELDDNQKQKHSNSTQQQQQIKVPTKREYKKGELIDSGAFAQVFQGLDMKTGKLLAIKTVKLQGNNNKIISIIMALKQEIKLLKKLNHKNIIKYLFTEVSDDMTYVDIALEFIPCGSLRSVLDKVKLEEQTVRVYTRQILEGVAYLHQNGVIHRDIKGANILIDTDGTIKLTDFGTSKLIEPDEDQIKLNQSFKGTPYWMAPEVVNMKGHSYAADIWSIGGVIIEMLSGHPPYADSHSSLKDILQEISANKKPTYPPKASPLARDFLNLIYVDQHMRPTAQQLLQHNFVNLEYFTSTTTEDPKSTKPRFSSQHSEATAKFGYQDKPIVTAANQAVILQDQKLKEEKLKKQKEWEQALKEELCRINGEQ